MRTVGHFSEERAAFAQILYRTEFYKILYHVSLGSNNPPSSSKLKCSWIHNYIPVQNVCSFIKKINWVISEENIDYIKI